MESLSTALITLLVAIVVALTALVERVRRDLVDNTSLTKETKAAANGTLHKAMERLEAAQEKVERLQEVIRDQQDKISFLSTKIPEAQEILASYRDRRERDEPPPCIYRRS